MVECITHAIPWLGWLWGPKTIRAGRWGRIGNAFENSNAFSPPTAYRSLAGSDNGIQGIPSSLGYNRGAKKLYRKYTITMGLYAEISLLLRFPTNVQRSALCR